jgi:hypothetical protein
VHCGCDAHAPRDRLPATGTALAIAAGAVFGFHVSRHARRIA